MPRTPAFAALVVTSFAIVLGSGCAVAAGDGSEAASDPGDPNTGGTAYEAEALTAGCTKAAMLAAAPADRRAILDRAFQWVDDRIPYSQSAYHNGYRTDCSGYVSMCWGLSKPGQTTSNFAPGASSNSRVISWNDLQPGDALNKYSEHIILFGGWLDEAHTRFCSVAEHHTGTVTSAGVSTRSYYESAGFKPITFTHMPGGSTDGGGSSGGSSGGGGAAASFTCYSHTLSREEFANACVQSKFDRVWYQCTAAGWKERSTVPTACSSEHPL